MRIGIDLGGTSVKAALCADDGAILIKQSVPTKTGDPDGLRADMKQLALALCASGGVQPDEVESIGIGVPGSYDKPSCTLRFGTNLGMNDVCFAETFQPEFGCTVQLDNDANCADIARMCMKYEVPIVVDSDSHICFRVGHVEGALDMLEEIGFPEELIINSSMARLDAYFKGRGMDLFSGEE